MNRRSFRKGEGGVAGCSVYSARGCWAAAEMEEGGTFGSGAGAGLEVGERSRELTTEAREAFQSSGGPAETRGSGKFGSGWVR